MALGVMVSMTPQETAAADEATVANWRARGLFGQGRHMGLPFRADRPATCLEPWVASNIRPGPEAISSESGILNAIGGQV